jgi:hypothetical protein
MNANLEFISKCLVDRFSKLLGMKNNRFDCRRPEKPFYLLLLVSLIFRIKWRKMDCGEVTIGIVNFISDFSI